jgi:hypothetical protein
MELSAVIFDTPSFTCSLLTECCLARARSLSLSPLFFLPPALPLPFMEHREVHQHEESRNKIKDLEHQQKTRILVQVPIQF